jgi:hypothetical protein
VHAPAPEMTFYQAFFLAQKATNRAAQAHHEWFWRGTCPSPFSPAMLPFPHGLPVGRQPAAKLKYDSKSGSRARLYQPPHPPANHPRRLIASYAQARHFAHSNPQRLEVTSHLVRT